MEPRDVEARVRTDRIAGEEVADEDVFLLLGEELVKREALHVGILIEPPLSPQILVAKTQTRE